MTVNHVVVDGSNLATEGHTLPSLQQLDEAVRAYLEEFSPKTVTVIVDASFPNRIEESEKPAFEEAIQAGELITPPAGVIGRGDAFLLQIADRADAVVLSNDSFQEFHGQYGWLFEQGRLIGGKPIPHVGWVFMERSPVRGPLSRRSVSDAKKAKAAKAGKEPSKDVVPASGRGSRRSAPKEKATTESAPTTAPSTRGGRGRGRQAAAPAAGAELATATAKAGAERGEGRGGRRRRGGSNGGGGGGGGSTAGVQPYNDALPFIEFVGAHPVGSTVEGEVERFASHGAYVMADGARCYLPLKHLGDPPPRSAREVLSFGETYKFVVHAFDTPRRGVDLTMPGVVPSGTASDPVPDQLTEEERVAPAKKAAAKRSAAKKTTKKSPAKKSAAKKAPAKKSAAKKAPTKKKAAAKKAPARKTAAKKAPAKKAAAKKTTKKATKKKAAAKKAPAKKKSAAKKAPARKKAAAKRAPAKKAAKKR